MKAFKNASVYVYGEGIKKTDLLFDDKIRSFDSAAGADVIKLPADAVVLPGFIDEHIHGAGGCDAMDATLEALQTIAQTVAAEGTTGFLATTLTQSPENITKALQAVKEYRAKEFAEGAAVLGVHLEGPFIAPAHNGAQPLAYVAKASTEVFDAYNAACGNCIKIVTLAPEEEGAATLMAYLAKKGIVPSVGHSGAKYTDITKAIAAGAKNVTHTFNAQSALHHREIGVVGSALLCDELCCELICDTIHVSVPAMQLLNKCKPQGKVTLITDGMRAKGLRDGISEIGGQKVYVKGSEARLENGTLAGSVLRMNRAVQNFTEKVGASLEYAADCASIVPAKTLGVDAVTGSITLGKNADFTVLDKNFDVLYTVRQGNIIYGK